VTRLTRTMRSLPPVHAPRLRALIDAVRGTVTSPDPAVLPRVTHPVRDRTSLLPAAPSANPAVLPPHAGVSAATVPSSRFRNYLVPAGTSFHSLPPRRQLIPAVRPLVLAVTPVTFQRSRLSARPGPRPLSRRRLLPSFFPRCRRHLIPGRHLIPPSFRPRRCSSRPLTSSPQDLRTALQRARRCSLRARRRRRAGRRAVRRS